MEAIEYPPLNSRPTFPSRKRKWPRKIALEEAITTTVFNPTSTLPPSDGGAELPYVNIDFLEDVKKRLSDVDLRIEAMDKADIALTVVSLAMPGIEGIFDTTTAMDIARKANDEIHRLYTAGKYADRFRAFACVAMQDPVAAAAEAERCVKVFGFVGVLINGYCNIGGPETVQYLDEPQCEPFWAKLEELNVPLYSAVKNPPDSNADS